MDNNYNLKQEQEKTNQQRYCIRSLISQIIAYIAEDYNLTPKQAMQKFFSTKISEKIELVGTGYYLEGPGYVYQIVKEEF
ncbi:MAG: hypothetical protein LBM65_01630 [Oscillospiraceae bacterium]|nr:hypothetical protein [Oscillospiraceae bacterium]